MQARWRAHYSLRWATNPHALAMAHGVNAKAEYLGDNWEAAKQHIALALKYMEEEPEIQELREMKRLRAELLTLKAKLD